MIYFLDSFLEDKIISCTEQPQDFLFLLSMGLSTNDVFVEAFTPLSVRQVYYPVK